MLVPAHWGQEGCQVQKAWTGQCPTVAVVAGQCPTAAVAAAVLGHHGSSDRSHQHHPHPHPHSAPTVTLTLTMAMATVVNNTIVTLTRPHHHHHCCVTATTTTTTIINKKHMSPISAPPGAGHSQIQQHTSRTEMPRMPLPHQEVCLCQLKAGEWGWVWQAPSPPHRTYLPH